MSRQDSDGTPLPPSVRSLRDAERAWSMRSARPGVACALVEQIVASPDASPLAVARALAARGNAMLRTEGGDAAEPVLRDALERGRQAGDPTALGRARIGLGVLDLRAGRYPAAMRSLHAAAEDFRQAGESEGVAGALVNMAVVHKNLGDHAGALQLLHEARDAFSALGDRHGEAVALSNVVAVYRDLGDHRAAVPLAEQVVALTAALDEPGLRAYSQACLGAVLCEADEVDRGRALLEGAISQAEAAGNRQAHAEALGSLARVLHDEDADRARALLGRGVELIREQGDTWTLVEALLALGGLTTEDGIALSLVEQAAALADDRGSFGQAARAHLAAAQRCEALGDVGAALSHYQGAARAAQAAARRRRDRRLALLEISAAVTQARAEATAQRARIAELTRTGRHRADLLAMIAHDLNGPLTVATLCSDSLAASVGGDPHGKTLLERLDAALARITRLVESVGDEAAAEHGQLVLDRREEDLRALVDGIVAEHRPRAEGKDQRLRVRGGAIRGQVDAARLVHAIDNLLSNALKFSPRRAVITVGLRRVQDGVRIEVDDEGPGVDAAERRRLFDPFVRGAAAPTAGEGSTGLGLYITRRVVEAHGGTVGVEANPRGRGARFWIALPD